MKIAAVCVTYLRPVGLGRMLACFLQQDYPDRELVILDDAGQYDDQEGDRWRLVSVSKRYPTLGEKRNAAVGMVSPQVEALAVWDDDDLYLPGALTASVAALETAAWSRPSIVLLPQADGTLKQHETGGLFQGGWAYRRTAFDAGGGYPAKNNGEDQALAARLSALQTTQADPIALEYAPFYVYSWGNPWGDSSPGHISSAGPRGYLRRGKMRARKARLRPVRPPIDLHNPKILPGVHPRPF